MSSKSNIIKLKSKNIYNYSDDFLSEIIEKFIDLKKKYLINPKNNELYINNGDNTFTESAKEYGINDIGNSVQATFFDYDKDGDLDLYVANYPPTPFDVPNAYYYYKMQNVKDEESDNLYRNDNGSFTKVTDKAGLRSYGLTLSATIGDINNDSYPDIFVSNDFSSPDYMYINNQDGTFSEKLTDAISSISAASMGADMADIDNDGMADIFVTEMLPSEYERLKSVTTFENWDKYKYNVDNGYYHQFTRNTLQLNNGDDTFSEIGRLAGVEASDWSWGALFFDMNNDGLRDLFIANGIYRDLTDQDYLQYVSSEQVLMSIFSNEEVDYASLVEIIPSRPVKNHAYINLGDLRFENDKSTGLLDPSFSNGSAYGDLDNDGDLDLVVNNVNMPSFVYENQTDKKDSGNYIQFDLKGIGKNTMAIGTQIRVYDGLNYYYIQHQPTRGFQSSVDLRPHIGLPTKNNVDIEVTWTNGLKSNLDDVEINQIISISQSDVTYSEPNNKTKITSKALFERVNSDMKFSHAENIFIDFNKNRLLPHMLSTPGPKIVKGDINGDGLEEILIPGSKDNKSRLFKWEEENLKLIESFELKEEVPRETIEPVFFDADGDGLGSGNAQSFCNTEVPDGWVNNNNDEDDNCYSNYIDCSGTCDGDAIVQTYWNDVDGDGNVDNDDCIADCNGDFNPLTPATNYFYYYDNDGDGLVDSEDEDEFGDPREYATKVAVKKIAQDILNEIMTSW